MNSNLHLQDSEDSDTDDNGFIDENFVNMIAWKNRPEDLFNNIDADSNISENAITIYCSCESALSAVEEQEKPRK